MKAARGTILMSCFQTKARTSTGLKECSTPLTFSLTCTIFSVSLRWCLYVPSTYIILRAFFSNLDVVASEGHFDVWQSLLWAREWPSRDRESICGFGIALKSAWKLDLGFGCKQARRLG
jgi:hypothetical protein